MADSPTEHAASAYAAHKLLARLPDGRCVGQASAQTLLSVLPETVAVVATDPPELPRLLSESGCDILTVSSAPRGMGISLAAAARRLLGGSHPDGHVPGCVVALADMPWLHAGTIKNLLRHAGYDRIVVPVHRGQRGHPVIFGARFLPELAELNGDTGARALLSRHGALEIDCDDSGILRDVDVPADLA
ncbi:hypothetical protein CAL20_11820 [Bordetella genomosp. 4]|uniref:MobA-like NTP transferase domain-containing protein n=2 Tax=Bordetella genomosp. 4 TaxID=463044 RepID=A0A261U2G0_9BORD|nr:hypothetical protein CAL21_08995 [Bordetella genomosp. 4]OZI56128.1 hypothetical protein CAL20_11820 [Bordetella genomosp. 4]